MKGGTSRSRTLWTFVVTSLALVMVTLDNLVVTTALPVIRKDLGARDRGARVDRERVHAHVRRPAPDRRGARRPLRAAAAVRDRADAVHARLGRGGARAVDRGARRRAGGAGRGRGDHHPADADDPLRGGAGREARRRARRLGRDRRPRRRARPARRRRRRLGPLVAVDLLDQRPDRPRARCRWRCGAWTRRTARPTASTCPASASPAPGCSESSGASSAATARAGRAPRSSLALAAGAAARRRLRRLGAADGRADAADAVLPQPDVRDDEHRLAPDVLRDVRLDLPARAVLPDRAGLLAVRLGAADPAVDGDADLRRPDRGRALRPDRRAAADGARARPAGDRARLDGR